MLGLRQNQAMKALLSMAEREGRDLEFETAIREVAFEHLRLIRADLAACAPGRESNQTAKKIEQAKNNPEIFSQCAVRRGAALYINNRSSWREIHHMMPVAFWAVLFRNFT